MSDIDHTIPAAPPAAKPGVSYLEWGAIFGGAVVAGALTVVLTQFGTGIGLATADPTVEDGLTWGIFLVGLWIVLVAFASASAGGYVAGRMRSHFGDGTKDESEFRDGIHGIVVWALATVVMGLAAGLSAAISGLAAPAADPEVSAELMSLMHSASTITAFASGAGAVLAAAGAWFAAVAGGSHRDEGIAISEFRGPFFRRRTLP